MTAPKLSSLGLMVTRQGSLERTVQLGKYKAAAGKRETRHEMDGLH